MTSFYEGATMFGLNLFKTPTGAAAKLIMAGAFCAVAGGVQASTLVADGITYSLDYTVVDPYTETFTLGISGINSASDTEGGRIGVNAIAFNDPYSNTAPTSVTAPTGFSYMPGGLNSAGCNGAGNFFCFDANVTPSGSPLAAGSTLSYTFTISTANALFPTGYAPDFKIDWTGTKNNYDLVSKTLTPSRVSPVPLPAAGLLLVGALGALGAAKRRRRQA